MITRSRIKTLLDANTGVEEQTAIINEMLTTYDLDFTFDYLFETYSIIRDSIRKYDESQKFNELKDIVTINSIIAYVVKHSLNKNLPLHNSLLRAIYDRNFNFDYFGEMVLVYTYDCKNCCIAPNDRCVCENKKMEIYSNVMQCPYDMDNDHIFRLLLRYGKFDFEEYCDKVTNKNLQQYVDEFYSGRNTKGVVRT